MKFKPFFRCCNDIVDILFPRCCAICGNTLTSGEKHICIKCYMRLPFTRWKGRQGNPMERIFWTYIPIRRANALLHYYGGDESRKTVLALKYYRRPQLGAYLGRLLAADLRGTDFFKDVDALVPIPLSKHRQRKRGYNQSELLAVGVSEVTGIPILRNAIKRMTDNPTQTHLSAEERKDNVRGIFQVVNGEQIRGKHILLIDDVLTTGATVLSCAGELSRQEGVEISILSLFIAGNHGSGPQTGK